MCVQPAQNARAFFFFFNDPAPPEIYPLPLPDALPICADALARRRPRRGAGQHPPPVGGPGAGGGLEGPRRGRSEEHTSELQSRLHLVCRLLLEKKKK